MSVDPQDLRRMIFNVALARRRVHEIMGDGSLASLEYEYELAFVKQVLVTVHSRLREVYTDGFEGTAVRLTAEVWTQEAGVGEDDHPRRGRGR